MGIIRVTFSKTEGRSKSYHRYPDGREIEISKEGVLYIFAGEEARTAGAYAPGNWVDAYFEDSIGLKAES